MLLRARPAAHMSNASVVLLKARALWPPLSSTPARGGRFLCNPASSIWASVEDSYCFSMRYATSGILRQLHALPVHVAGRAAMYWHRSCRRPVVCRGFSDFPLARVVCRSFSDFPLAPMLLLLTLVTLLPACCGAGCVLGMAGYSTELLQEC